MKICEGQTDNEAMQTIRLAVIKVWRAFRREAFDFEDIFQETYIGLMPNMPFAGDGGLLYTAAKRMALSYYNHVAKTNKERGARAMGALDAPINDEHFEWTELGRYDPTPDWEINEALDSYEVHLDSVELVIFRGLREGKLQKDIAAEIGLHPSRLPYLRQRMIRSIRDGCEVKERHTNNRRDSKDIKMCAPNSLEVDRQRLIKRLANTR